MSARILSLHIYPIKSCAGIDLSESPIDRAGLAHDRRWMLIDGSGQFMTQRQWPRMALIRTAIDDGALRVSAPDMADLLIALDGSGLEAGSETVTVWKDSLPALREAPPPAAGSRISWARPVACTRSIPPRADRPRPIGCRAGWMRIRTSPSVSGTHHFGFADGFPLLVANQASLDDLNARLRAKGAAEVPMDRFRPNIVVQGTGRHSKRTTPR